tara:strand:- start:243 stop:452 length:210 start_codon:yes stop_codon:yes gene_type:complete
MTTILKFLLWIIVFIAAGYITLFAIGILLNILAWMVLAPVHALVLFLFFGISGYIALKITKWLIETIFK